MNDKNCSTPINGGQPDYKAEYKRVREENVKLSNVKLSTENHYLRNAVVSMSIQLFGGTGR